MNRIKEASAYSFFCENERLLAYVCLYPFIAKKYCRSSRDHAWSEFKDVTPKQVFFCNFLNSPTETGK